MKSFFVSGKLLFLAVFFWASLAQATTVINVFYPTLTNHFAGPLAGSAASTVNSILRFTTAIDTMATTVELTNELRASVNASNTTSMSQNALLTGVAIAQASTICLATY